MQNHSQRLVARRPGSRSIAAIRGMTLIEILVVLTLIGIVMGIVGGNYLGQGEKAKAKAAKIEIEQIGQTLDLFKLEVGRYPTTQEGLQALITAPTGMPNWNGPLLEKEHPAEGPVDQRVQVRVARPARRLRPVVLRRRRQGRRRGNEQGHHELAMKPLRAMPGPHRGVTLLELLIVLTLMALIAAMVLPMFSGGVSGTDLKTAARDVAAGLRLARDRAIAQRTESLLELNLEARTFRVSPDERSHRLPEKLDLKLYTAQRDLLNDKVGAIRFFPDGGSNGGRITLAAGERKYDVDVDWLTGRVAILE